MSNFAVEKSKTFVCLQQQRLGAIIRLMSQNKAENCQLGFLSKTSKQAWTKRSLFLSICTYFTKVIEKFQH
jgi:hypothetical protein